MKETKRRIRSAVLAIFLIMTAFGVPAMTTSNVSAKPEPTPIDCAMMPENINISYVPGEVIVGFHDSIPEDADVLVAQYGGELMSKNDALNFILVKQETDSDYFISSINCHPSVAYAERNNIVYLTQFPNDPAFWNPIETGNPHSQQWGPQKIHAPDAWPISQGSGEVVIAVLDTGVDYTHRDLNKHIWYNTRETPYNDNDDDGNGFIDDYIGWNFVNNNNDIMDYHSHGTHCAGIAVAAIDNGIGIAGISQASLMAVKVSSLAGEGDIETVANGIVYATDNGADIISMSFGLLDYTNTLRNACDYAWNKGLLLIASSGNRAPLIPGTISHPAAYESVIAVGATNQNDERCSEEDWGVDYGSEYSLELELVAPGNNIVSTINHYPIRGFVFSGDRYEVKSGTSQAAPHVAGVAALILSVNPYLTNQQVRDVLRQSADDLIYTRGSEVAVVGWDQYTGYGRVNAQRAMSDATSPTISSFSINSGTTYTNNKDVSLSINVNDVGLGVSNIRFSNTNSASWQQNIRVIESSHGSEGWNGEIYCLDPYDHENWPQPYEKRHYYEDVLSSTIVESIHPYPNINNEYTWTINKDSNVVRIRIGFSKINLAWHDTLRVYDLNGNLLIAWTGTYPTAAYENMWTPYFSGNSATIVLTTNGGGSAWGFHGEVYKYYTMTSGDYSNNINSYWYITGDNYWKYQYVNKDYIVPKPNNRMLHFDYIELAPGDILTIGDSQGQVIQYTGPCSPTNLWLPPEASGTTFYGDITIRLQTDSEYTARGFRTDYYRYAVGYPRNYDNSWTIKEPSATQMKVHFEKIELANGDFVHLYDGNDVLKYSYTGNYNNAFWSEAISGDTVKVRFVSNSDFYTAWGFKIDQYQYYDAPWSAWQPYSTNVDWQLSSGDGLKTVYCQVMDYAGNIAQASDTITLDTTGPTAPVATSSTHPDLACWYPTNDVTIGWTPLNGASPMVGYSLELDHIESTIPDTTVDTELTTKHYSDVADGIWYVHVRALDGAGNWGETSHYGPIKIDVPPVIRLQPRETWVGGTAEKDYVNSDAAGWTHYTIKWDPADEPLGVQRYELQEWDSRTGVYTTFPDVITGTSFTVAKYDVPDGTYFYYRVRAQSSTTTAGGFWGALTGSSDGITIDRIPPSPITGISASIAKEYSTAPSNAAVKYGHTSSNWYYTECAESDDVYWTLSEEVQGYLVQKAEAIFEMPISTGSGTSLTVGVEAYQSTYYNEHFAFYYATSPSGPYTWMFEVSKTMDDNVPYEFDLPAGTYYGTIFIKVMDTLPGDYTFEYDSISIDSIYLKWNSDIIDTTSLNLDWTPSTSTDVEYYEIYSSSTPTGFDFGEDEPIAVLSAPTTSWLEHGGIYDEPAFIKSDFVPVNDYVVYMTPVSPLKMEAMRVNGGDCNFAYFNFTLLNAGLPDSYTLCTPSLPSGITVSFFPQSPIILDSGSSTLVTVRMMVASNVPLAKYKLSVRAISNCDGTAPYEQDQIDFMVDVVPDIEEVESTFYTVVAVDYAGNKGICLDLTAGKITAEPAGQFSIDIKKDLDWNFISTPFVQTDNSPGYVLHTIRATDIPPIKIGNIGDFPITIYGNYWGDSTPTYYRGKIPYHNLQAVDTKLRVGPIDLSNLGPNVSSIIFELEHSFSGSYNWDNGAIVECSIDGSNFFKLSPSGGLGYNGRIIYGTTPILGTTAYTCLISGVDRFDLTQFIGKQSFYLRFRICTNPYPWETTTWDIIKAGSQILAYKWNSNSPFALRYDAALDDYTVWPKVIENVIPPPRPHPDPGPCTQLMTSIDNKMGVHVNVLGSDQTLITTGTIPISTTIHLHPGLNEVGYPSFLKRTVAEAMAGIPYEMIYTYDSTGVYIVLGPDDIMQPGVGYDIIMTQNAYWVVSGLGRLAGITPGEVVVQPFINEGDETTLSTIITNNDGSPASNVVVNFFVSSEPTLIESLIIPIIQSEESIEVSTTWIAEPGQHEFRVTVDYNGNITDGYVSEGISKTYVNAKSVPDIEAYQELKITLSVAGRKDNSVGMRIYEDGTLIQSNDVMRTPGPPNTITIDLNKYLDRVYDIELVYNATHKGANPTTLKFTSSGTTLTFSHTFNTQEGYCQTIPVPASYLNDVVENNPTFWFDASGSYDIDGEIASCEWDFGDGTTSIGMEAEHTYLEPGIYTVALTVTDNDGAIARETITVEVR